MPSLHMLLGGYVRIYCMCGGRFGVLVGFFVVMWLLMAVAQIWAQGATPTQRTELITCPGYIANGSLLLPGPDSATPPSSSNRSQEERQRLGRS